MNRCIAVTLALAACHSSDGKPSDAIALPGPANGLVYDAAQHELYLTDDAHDQLVGWTAARGFETIGALPPAQKVGYGGLVRLRNGMFLATSFGFGTDGAVVTFAQAKSATLANLDKTRRRIGLAVADDGTLYDAYFTVAGKVHTGGVAKLSLDGSESEIVLPDLGKAVGLAADAKALYITDQERGLLLAYDFAGGATRTIAKDLPGADLLTLLPNGDFITGGKHGEVYLISHTDGTTKVVTTFVGKGQVRGTAYDAEGKRLFAVEHAAKGAPDQLHIVPLAI